MQIPCPPRPQESTFFLPKDDNKKESPAVVASSSPQHGPHITTSSIISSSSIHHRVTYKQLCQAAGGQSLEKLKHCIESGDGWTSNDINYMVSGKSALHMAAWKGCLENVEYLVEVVKCDINAFSIAQYSYGKTAIFFAATQSRTDVVEYLIDHFPTTIKVNIVNNKGQSPLSICASHDIPSRVLSKIQQRSKLEEEKEEKKKEASSWWNFRASHSDGLEYGDLEPRFLDRPLRETDVITQLAINPTTKESRKIAFERRSKYIINNGNEPPKTRLPKKKRLQQKLTSTGNALQLIQQHEFWDQIAKDGKIIDDGSEEETAGTSVFFIKLIEFCSKYIMCSWVPNVAKQLVDSLDGNIESAKDLIKHSINTVVIANATAKMTNDDHHNKRVAKLMEKILIQVCSMDSIISAEESSSTISTGPLGNHARKPSQKQARNSNQQKKQGKDQKVMLTLDRWKMDLQTIMMNTALSISIFQKAAATTTTTEDNNGGVELQEQQSHFLTLTESPIFVNTLEQFLEMKMTLKTSSILSIDTEWYDDDDSNNGEKERKEGKDKGVVVGISIIQISAIVNADPQNNTQNAMITTYVVDLMFCHDYRSQVQVWIRRILESDEILVLGFAIGNDVPHLERFCCENTAPLRCQSILDLQRLLCSSELLDGDNRLRTGSVASLPGLKACVSRFTDIPLSKKEQSSNWARRPLTAAQLNYAGMDAAVLLVLLSEYLKIQAKKQDKFGRATK